MVVKDLLMQCLTDDIIKVVWKKGYENANIDKVYNSYSPLITELKNRIPNISDYVILGIDWINFGEPMPDCVLYNINEIKTEFKINDKFEKISDVNILSDSEIEELINDYKHPTSYGYEYEPWDNILGFQIDENNAEKFGKTRLLANILYEMTFFGFSEENIDKERKILDQRTKEMDEILKLPKEEQEKYFILWETLKKELEIEDDSPEKELRKRKEMNREILYNNLQSYRVLKEYVNTNLNENIQGY